MSTTTDTTKYAIAIVRADGKARYARSIYRPQVSGEAPRIGGWTWDAEQALTWKTQTGAEQALTLYPRDGAQVVEIA